MFNKVPIYDQLKKIQSLIEASLDGDTISWTNSLCFCFNIFVRKKRMDVNLLSSHLDEPTLPPCPDKSPLLIGPLSIKQNEILDSDPDSEEFKAWFGSGLEIGGASRPSDCVARQKVAVIVPYRWSLNMLQCIRGQNDYFRSLLTTFEVCNIYGAAEAVANICLSQK